MSKLISRWVRCLNSAQQGAADADGSSYQLTKQSDDMNNDGGAGRLPMATEPPPGGIDVAQAERDAAKFLRMASDERMKGLDYDSEGTWNGPFCFLQAADTQLGMMANFNEKVAPSHWNSSRQRHDVARWDQEICLMQKLVSKANRMRPKPRFVVVCGDLVDAMPGVSYRRDQVRDYKAVLSSLEPDIWPICVCGNHDVGDTPTPETVAQYRRDFGDDHFSFWVGGVKFLTINSQYYHDASLTQDLSRQQQQWMDREIQSNPDEPWKHLVGFQHIPPFVVHRDEAPVDIFGNSKLSFNFADKNRRFEFLDKLKAAGMTKLFCGHYHRNAGGWDDTLEVVVTTAIGCQLGQDTHGCRVVRVMDDRIEHTYWPLDELPDDVHFAQAASS